jgi:rubrerythrin
MKKLFLLPLFAAFFLFACNSSDSSDESTENTEETTDGEHMHDDADHDEMHMDDDGHMHDDSMEGMMTDTSAYEYTAAYVCPMHCEGSGSEEPGSCPVCGMDYVENK